MLERKRSSVKSSSSKRSCFANIFNCWTLPILLRYKSKNEQLDIKDLPSIPEEASAATLGQDLSILWDSSQPDKKSLARILINYFGWSFIRILLLLLFQQCILRLCIPIFIGMLIHCTDGSGNWKLAIPFSIAFVSNLFLSSFIFHPCILQMQKLGMKIRVGLTALIYRKVLRLSQKSLSTSGIGQLTNILSNDVNRFDDSLEFIPFVIIGPIQAALAIYILWRYVGAPCLAGLGLLIFLILLQGFLGREFGQTRLRIAEITDKRIRAVTELINGILLIKMLAWEDTFSKDIKTTRRQELELTRRKNYVVGFNMSLFETSVRLSVLLTFLTYVVSGNSLSTETLFVTLCVYNTIGLILGSFLPSGVSGLSEIWISLNRIETVLNLEENVSEITKLDEDLKDSPSVGIQIQNLNASWGSSATPTLRNISMNAKSGDLIGIVGPVGSGKSSLLQTILGELPSNGVLEVNGVIAYSSQDPWLFSGSLRENILFGANYEASWYNEVIEACGLEDDLQKLKYGDETLVGDKGVALSGGQKSRVNLARAVYSRADIYLLDDPLSALDVRVSLHVRNKCLEGLLRNKCVILVTHQMTTLRGLASRVILMDNGQIAREGSFENVLQQNDDTTEDDENILSTVVDDIELDEDVNELSAKPKQTLKPIAEAELTREGGISLKLFLTLFKYSNSYLFLGFVIFVTLSTQLLLNGSDMWLKFWADHQNTSRLDSSLIPGKLNQSDAVLLIPILPTLPHGLEYVTIYGGIVAVAFFFSLIRVLTVLGSLLNSGKKLQENLLDGILHAPISFFQLNSSGLILKLFSNDVGVMDEVLPLVIFKMMGTGLQVIGSTVLVAILNPILVIPIALLYAGTFVIQKIYVKSSGTVKRLESVARSPVFAHLTTTLNGISTIRAYKAQDHFYATFLSYQDKHSSAFTFYLASFRWLALTLEVMYDLYIAILLAYLLIIAADSAILGLSLTVATGTLNEGTGFIMFSALAINHMPSIERILDYSKIQSEETSNPSPENNDGYPSWPENGDIEYKNVNIAYANGPNILHNVTFEIDNAEKIGIIGRTGAGKSSLTSSLFRLVEPNSGQIQIAGVDTSKLRLRNIRTKLSIIPQNPILLAGSLRRNIDPHGEFTDNQIWDALDAVQLKKRASESSQGLEYEILEGATNLSQGERQLISLARTILRRNRILILDEATANIDLRTDELIQKTLREKFRESTVLTIAHRLETVMDSDRILVLDSGTIKEFDKPRNLLQDPNSLLSQLLNKCGQRNAKRLRSMVQMNQKD